MKQTLVGDRNRGEIKIGKTDIIDESDDRSHRATKPHRFTAEKAVNVANHRYRQLYDGVAQLFLFTPLLS